MNKVLLLFLALVSFSLLAYANHCTGLTTQAACETAGYQGGQCNFGGGSHHKCVWQGVLGPYPPYACYDGPTTTFTCTSGAKVCRFPSQAVSQICTVTGDCDIVNGDAVCRLDCADCGDGWYCAAEAAGGPKCVQKGGQTPHCDSSAPDKCIKVSDDPLQYDLLLSQTCTIVHCDPGWGCATVTTASGGTTVRCVEPSPSPTTSQTPVPSDSPAPSSQAPVPPGGESMPLVAGILIVGLATAGYSVWKK